MLIYFTLMGRGRGSLNEMCFRAGAISEVPLPLLLLNLSNQTRIMKNTSVSVFGSFITLWIMIDKEYGISN